MLAMFMALFAITAPIAAVPLFVAATEGQSESERRRTALIAAATYVFAGLVALFAGNAALSFFGVSVAALRLAGMAVVAVIGWQMINAPTAIAEPIGSEGKARLHAASNTRIDRADGRPARTARERTDAICAATRLFTLAESLGGVESLIEVPAVMTHASVAGSQLEVPEALIRLSCGIEASVDLVADLRHALDEA